MKTSRFNRCLFNEKAFQSALPQSMYLLIRAYSFIQENQYKVVKKYIFENEIVHA